MMSSKGQVVPSVLELVNHVCPDYINFTTPHFNANECSDLVSKKFVILINLHFLFQADMFW